jgi:hypothetical protein
MGIPNIISIEKLIGLLASIQHTQWWHSKHRDQRQNHLKLDVRRKGTTAPAFGNERNIPEHLDYASELIVFTRARKQRQPQEQFHSDTTQRPHINRSGVRHAQQNFRRSVKPRLDVGVYSLPLVAGRAKVDNFYLRRL